jgi:phosphate uptake regulator
LQFGTAKRCRKWALRLEECLAYRVLVKFVERIADHFIRRAEVTRSLKKAR